MRNWKVLWAVIAVLLAVIVILALDLTKSKTEVIDSFESCAAGGNPVAESYPRQCYAKDGRRFVEEVVPPTAPAPSAGPDVIACTQEAKQCPDGTWVGRTGPNCEFVCPGETK